jgi:hypothetical protein
MLTASEGMFSAGSRNGGFDNDKDFGVKTGGAGVKTGAGIW